MVKLLQLALVFVFVFLAKLRATVSKISSGPAQFQIFCCALKL